MENIPKKLFIAADCDVTLEDLIIRSTAASITTATVTYSLKDVSLVELGTGTLSHVSAGDYLGVIESTVTDDLTENATYYVDITTVSSSYNDFIRMKCTAVYKGPDDA